MNKSKLALLHSVVALILCVSMLLGSTWAWFTDTVESTNNIIQTGTLNAELSWNKDNGAEWEDASTGTIFDYKHWEPGYVDIKYVKVENTGSLAFRYRLNVIPEELPVEGAINLSDVIDVYMIPTDKTISREQLGTDYQPVGTLTDLITDSEGAAAGILLPTQTGANVTLNEEDKEKAETGTTTYCIALKMQETAGNDYQNKSVGGKFRVQLLATQYTYENDSFGNDYDTDSVWPGSWKGTTPVSVDGGVVTEAASIGTELDPYSAAVPAGVKMADGAEELALTIESLRISEADIVLEGGETATSLDIHMDGLSEENSQPVLITLKGLMKKGLNSTSVAMYHVEDGVTVPMTLVTNPVNHNEFSYDPATGDVVMAVASFSEYVAVTDNKNLWEGAFDTTWYNTTDTAFTLNSADQLAGFGKIVDGAADGIAADTFAGKTVLLGADIDLSGGYSLNPIGCGYADRSINSNNVTGRVFSGTFDGQGYTISGLYQNGWDIGLSYCNLGGGLFASIADGTVQNLTISGANIVMECVEQGILVGLSQGDCTYENINIYNSKVANYQRATGGLIGEVSPLNGGGTTTITDVVIGPDVVVGSLWGDFDAPVGGVIGARWDDSDTTNVVMENVTVACILDVYNDITSTYQWHAYRRAGMLIGNTDTPPANGKDAQTATADFLTCTNVVVKYGDWVNYHYCQFTNHNANWPWVRVEAGENCEAYSNPRYGVPNDNGGNKVVDANHTHQDGDTCMELIAFNQLYGGGQGVYGQPEHNGVTIESYDYTVTYMDRGEVYAIDYVSNDTDYTVKHTTYVPTRTESGFKAWVNAGGTKVETIEANNTTDYVLYDSWYSVYTARFVDQDGNVIYEEEFETSQTALSYVPAVPAVDGGFTGAWETYDLTKATGDIAIKPVYNANDGIISLTPVDSDGDGVTNYYSVTNVVESDDNVNIVIPESLNGIPVTEVSLNAFAEFDNITTVTIPTSVTKIGAHAFADKENSGILGTLKYEQITFLYEGTYEQWQAIEKDANWDRYVGYGSRIYFLVDGTYIEETARNGVWNATYREWSDPVAGTYTSSTT